MSDTVRYGLMRFASDFRFGVDDEGATVKFTRAERIVLTTLIENAARVLSRDRLLDAVSGSGSQAGDGNIDFLINRLRRKLADPARKPIYIETQYGEGYRWIAPPVKESADAAGAFLVIGPLRGLKHVGSFTADAQTFAEELRWVLDAETTKKNRIVVDADCPRPEDFVGEMPKVGAELSFRSSNGLLDCAVLVRIFATGQIVQLSRWTVVTDDKSDAPSVRTVAAAVAEKIGKIIWEVHALRGNALAAPSDAPLAVRMHDASLLFVSGNRASWADTDRRIRALLEKNPGDHQAQLMLATNIHTKYFSGESVLPEPDLRRQDEDDIERLVLASLPHLEGNPVFVLAAAKLLYFIDRGLQPWALDLAEKASAATTAFATSFAIYGQMRMFQGEFEEAMRLFDQGLELSGDSTEFELYLLVLKSEAMLASGDRKRLDDVLRTFYRKAPGAQAHVAALYASAEEGEIPPDALRLLDMIDAPRARRMLAWAHYTTGRLFAAEEHRENCLKGPLTLFVRRFGPEVVADDVRASVPALCDAVLRHEFARAADSRGSRLN